MSRTLRTLLFLIACSILIWSIAKATEQIFPNNDAIAAVLLLMTVLAVATNGDWVLAVLTSVVASLVFSYYFIESRGSLQITTAEGAVSFAAMLATAVTGSRLSIRAQQRAQEAVRRREEMERLHLLGRSLVATNTVSEAGEAVVRRISELFGGHAVLRLSDRHEVFSAQSNAGESGSKVVIPIGADGTVLELRSSEPSLEIRSALASLINLVLDRSRNAEERARVESIQRGEEMRNTVLNALAHNFTTPLTSIKAAASMLRVSPELQADERMEMVEVIEEEADRLHRMIRDSLDLVRLEAHREHPRVEPCSMAAIVARVTSELRRYFGKRKILVDMPADLAFVRGDRFLLEQMLLQVLDNAWKYSAPGTRVWVSAREEADRVILTVQNEGSHITGDEQRMVFDKFYRGAMNREAVQGTGLGLSIARSIAEAHGGNVWLDNEPTGPAFRFSLPAEAQMDVKEQEHDKEPHDISH